MCYSSEIILLFAILNLFSCNTENKDPQEGPLVFTGLTMTDDLGQNLSYDTNDWKLYELWSPGEKGLFTTHTKTICDTSSTKWQISAYPNPCGKVLNLWVSKPDSAMLNLRLVDPNLKVLFSADSIAVRNFSMNIESLNLPRGIYRIYYQLHGNDCQLNGHGDVEIQ